MSAAAAAAPQAKDSGPAEGGVPLSGIENRFFRVAVDPKTGVRTGAADPRGIGVALAE